MNHQFHIVFKSAIITIPFAESVKAYHEFFSEELIKVLIPYVPNEVQIQTSFEKMNKVEFEYHKNSNSFTFKTKNIEATAIVVPETSMILSMKFYWID